MMFAANPALVLNGDFQPLSYFPLSLFHWEDAIKAVVKGSHAVVAEDDQSRAQPVDHDAIAVGDRVARLRAAAIEGGVHPDQRLPARSLPLPILRRSAAEGQIDVRPRGSAGDGGRTQWDNIVAACGPCNMRKSRFRIMPTRLPREPTMRDLMSAQRLFPRNFLHETWHDFLYWDAELET
jgi:hypothetical protein